jgi:hypothetical protein
MNLEFRLSHYGLDDGFKQSILDQRVKLAGLELPSSADPVERAIVKKEVAWSFVDGFRFIMMICTVLALASAACAWPLIGRSRPVHTRKQ